MFTKDEKKDLIKRFWETLEEKLNTTGKTKGRNIDWMNYPNKINHLYFRMESNTELVRFCIDIQFLDPGVREVFFEQFEEFKVMLTEKMPYELNWIKSFEHTNSRTIARIYSELSDVSVFNEKDWMKSQQFLSDCFIAFDEFWADFGDAFKNLK